MYRVDHTTPPYVNPYTPYDQRINMNGLGQLLGIGNSILGFGKNFTNLPLGGLFGIPNKGFGNITNPLGYGGFGGYNTSPFNGLFGLGNKGMGGGGFPFNYGGNSNPFGGNSLFKNLLGMPNGLNQFNNPMGTPFGFHSFPNQGLGGTGFPFGGYGMGGQMPGFFF